MACLRKRGKTYYAQYILGGQKKRVRLHAASLQIAKEKIRQIESAIARDADIPLPTRTTVHQVFKAYVQFLNTVKIPRNTQRDFLENLQCRKCLDLKI